MRRTTGEGNLFSHFIGAAIACRLLPNKPTNLLQYDFSPSLINHMVSVDVKFHDYLLKVTFFPPVLRFCVIKRSKVESTGVAYFVVPNLMPGLLLLQKHKRLQKFDTKSKGFKSVFS